MWSGWGQPTCDPGLSQSGYSIILLATGIYSRIDSWQIQPCESSVLGFLSNCWAWYEKLEEAWKRLLFLQDLELRSYRLCVTSCHNATMSVPRIKCFSVTMNWGTERDFTWASGSNYIWSPSLLLDFSSMRSGGRDFLSLELKEFK